MPIDQSFIAKNLPHAEIIGSFPVDARFYTDSRLVTPGNVFVALKGARVDGHDYIHEVIKKGAGACVIASSKKESLLPYIKENKNVCFIIVQNPAEALITLARAWRNQFSIPIIGITGSINKTSTKEMLAQIMQTANISFVKSEGNQNTMIGLSMNLLRLRPEHDFGIFEMSVNKPGEMKKLTELVRPTTAIITTIGHSHCEGLGSLQDVAAEKRQIFSGFTETNIGIINGDVPMLSTISYPHPIIKFGTKTSNQIQARKIQIHGTVTTFILKLYAKKYTVTLASNHPSHVLAALASAAAAHIVGISDDVIVQGIQKPFVVPGRFQFIELPQFKSTLIHDAYNASPESMKAAITSFDKITSSKSKIAVLGDMLELGINSSYWHRQIGRLLRKAQSISQVILVGEHIKHALKTIPQSIQIKQVTNWQEASAILTEELYKNDVFVLVKASRGIGLDNLVKEIVR